MRLPACNEGQESVFCQTRSCSFLWVFPISLRKAVLSPFLPPHPIVATVPFIPEPLQQSWRAGELCYTVSSLSLEAT